MKRYQKWRLLHINKSTLIHDTSNISISTPGYKPTYHTIQNDTLIEVINRSIILLQLYLLLNEFINFQDYLRLILLDLDLLQQRKNIKTKKFA